jgi:hypothetical protein
VEVKGPGDQLSIKQRIWLEWFAENGFESQVCHVKSKHIFAVKSIQTVLQACRIEH